MEREDIIIRQAIVHILDSLMGVPVLSDGMLELSPDLNDFLRNHIYKIASGDELKNCQFNKEESQVYRILMEHKLSLEEELVIISKEISSHLYAIMNQNIEIPPADVVFVTYQYNSKLFLAILKMNYKTTYIHNTSSDDDIGNVNYILKQKATLPMDSQKLSEAILIDLEDFGISIIEKKYEINGEKIDYLSKLFLVCSTRLSSKTKFDIVTKAVKQVTKKYFEDDLDKHMELKSILHEELVTEGSINVERISNKVFKENDEIKTEFIEKVEKYNIVNDDVKLNNKQTTKKFEKQFLTTDSGIEINIPMEQYNNKQKIEFITNIDGTISVLIKNINKLTSK